MPTEDQILVPETLLKKRKSQEKQREERAAELEKKKKVSHCHTFKNNNLDYGDDTSTTATRSSDRCCRFC